MLDTFIRWLSLGALSICLGVFLVADGCYAPAYRYQVYIDPAFTKQEQASILRGEDIWRAVVPVEFTNHAGFNNGAPYTISIFKSTTLGDTGYVSAEGAIGVTVRNREEYSTIVLYSATIDNSPDQGDWEWQVVPGHELGHALGLVHTGDNTLMCAATSCGANTPQCTDINQFWSLRGVEYPCDEAPTSKDDGLDDAGAGPAL